jgi:nitrogen fixation protein FixH
VARAERRVEPWAVGVAAVLALGLTGPIAFLWIAVHAPPERVATDPWRVSLAQGAEERVRASGRDTGWDVTLVAERTSTGVRVELEPATTREPLPDGVELRLRRERPERADLDTEVALARSGDRWTADVPLPVPGRWRLVTRAGAGDVWIERSFALEVPP